MDFSLVNRVARPTDCDLQIVAVLISVANNLLAGVIDEPTPCKCDYTGNAMTASTNDV